MKTERLYRITISEYYSFCGNGTCIVAYITVKSNSADAALEKALKIVEKEIEVDTLLATNIECLDYLNLDK